MSEYYRLLKEVNFPDNSEEYRKLVLSKVDLTKDQHIDEEGISTKTSNIFRFKFREAIFATLKFSPNIPTKTPETQIEWVVFLAGFLPGLWDYANKLREYAKRELSEHEKLIVSYAAVMYRDSPDHTWPTKESLRERLPTSLTDSEFDQACDALDEQLGAIEFDAGRIVVIESIYILERE